MKWNEILFLIFLALLIGCVQEERSSDSVSLSFGTETGSLSVDDFLDAFIITHPAWSQFYIQRTRDRIEIPEELRLELSRYFSDYSFTIVKMEYFDMQLNPVNLLLVENHEINRVVRFLWDPMFMPTPPSFRRFLPGSFNNISELRGAVQVVAEVISLLMNGHAGDFVGSQDAVINTTSEGAIVIELLDCRNQEWHHLVVLYDSDMRIVEWRIVVQNDVENIEDSV
jgi:hypothetical protein